MTLYAVALGVAFLTAFYMFRLYFLTFEGPAPEHGHAHESPWTMTLPLVVLAALSSAAGFASLDYNGRSFGTYIRFDRGATLSSDWGRAQSLALAHPDAVGDYRKASALWDAQATLSAAGGPAAQARAVPAPNAPGTAPAMATASAGPAAKVAVSGRDAASTSGPGKGQAAALAVMATVPAADSRAFVLDYRVAVPATLVGLAGILLAFGVYRLKWVDPAKVAAALGPVYTTVHNKYYVDEFYRWMLDHGYYVLSGAIAWFDRHVVDGVMNGLALLMQAAGGALRRLQTGRVQAYALAMLGGILLLLGALKVLAP
jgi:NADH:ubiquinone oxidoreductase subunit 5 (subunit L)/multisubunit Na+/H+ antiporter MnhA subunit